MLFNNPYYYHPQPAIKLAADDVFISISQHPEWQRLFEQGKMLGVLLIEKTETFPSRVHNLNTLQYIVAYSGVVNGLTDEEQYFVPPIYDLQNPDDFYIQKDAEITSINLKIKDLEGSIENTQLQKQQSKLISELKTRRHNLSISLQKEIFSHFNLLNCHGQYKNIIDVFADAKRGLPPGGTGECAAPRLLQYAFSHRLKPLAMAEFWYGQSPKQQLRIHGHFYPSCIEKCSPLLSYMVPTKTIPAPISDQSLHPTILFEDDYIVAVNKLAGMLSVYSKDLKQPNVEQWLHQQFPYVKGPMLVHRLDQATSGILLAAIDANTHKLLQQQFENKQVKKMYIAVLKGKLKSSCGIIDLPLTVNPDDRPRQVVSHQFGKKATTYYQVIEDYNTKSIKGFSNEQTVIELYPLTGRTHQLRVHCASPDGLDNPIFGDSLYDIMDNDFSDPTTDCDNIADAGIRRLYLHAEKVTFVHPVTNRQVIIECPIFL